MKSIRAPFWLMAICTCAATAQEPAHTASTLISPISATPHQHIAETDLSAQSARDWGLTQEEWVRVKQLMRGPLGVYSPSIDPLTALGIEARSDTERKHIAELQVRMEAQRVEKLFAYQRAYDAAWRRVFPSIPPFQSSATARPLANTSFSATMRPASTGVDPVRLAVFVKEDCALCDQRVKELATAGTLFDLYMVGTRGDDARIRSWAARVQIDSAKVRAGIITLNHDGGRWLSLGLPGSLPAVLHSVQGQWIRE